MQRFLDNTLIVATAPVWLPFLSFLLILKYLADGRPLFFHQPRVGRAGVPFLLHKIKTTPASFQPSEQDWPDDNYPPRTRFGHWLRRFDLDELPQLWNVLKGEMSLVGPRPETPYHSANFARTLPGYLDRLAVPPGLTGLAQARGWRGNTSVAQRLHSDLEYIARASFGAYCITLLQTFLSVGTRGPLAPPPRLSEDCTYGTAPSLPPPLPRDVSLRPIRRDLRNRG